MNENAIAQISELLDRPEFVPFKIIVNSGHEYLVTRPHSVAVGKSHVYYCPNDEDKLLWLRASQITALEILQPA
jgi:hypothetical protein